MEPLLEAEGLVKEYGGGRHLSGRRRPGKRAVDEVSFHLRPRETYGLAGESGSGKSTLARLVTALIPTTAGRVRFLGRDVLGQSRADALQTRRAMQIVAQDPSRSLNPRQTVLRSVGLPYRVHLSLGGDELRERVSSVLDDVGLGPAERYLERFPHQLSGGQRQRVAIARAVALKPQLVVADEAVSALDVSVRAQVLALMKRLQQEYGLTYLFITHDLSVLRSIADRVGVMYLGRLVEEAPREALYGEPLHPYTRLLLAATPTLDPARRAKRKLRAPDTDMPEGELPTGCRFHPRCPLAFDRCAVEEPPLVEVAPDRRVACHLHPAPTAAGSVAP